MTDLMSSPVRVPVGSLIAVGPAGAGNSTFLKAALVTAGLQSSRAVNRDDLRRKFGNECSNLMCRAIPSGCTHHEDSVRALVEAHASTFLAAGKTWMYDPMSLERDVFIEQIDRAHRSGLAAVALRRAGENGQSHLTLDQCQALNATQARRLPNAVVAASHTTYTELTETDLYALGFDLVIDWDSTTTFELLPETNDARGVRTSQAVVVGDLHGCARTFFDRLLPAAGTDKDLSNPDVLVISVGDIHDKGADPQGSVELIRWWLRALRTGRALMVDSNHNRSLVRYLTGHAMRVSPGLADTLAAIDAQPDAEELKADIVASFSRLPSHLRFDDLVVVHAAITEDILGAVTARANGFMLYTNSARTPWKWTGSQTLVHGHEPVPSAARHRAEPDPTRPGHTPGEVINVDTGAYTGGQMTAYVHATSSILAVDTYAEEVADHEHSTADHDEEALAAA